jgi:predicted phosphodiesterase
MRLGVISDIHGNVHALDAVLADGRAQGVDRWWALGDLVAVAPDPVGTAARLEATPDLVATRGNTERYVLAGDRPPPHAPEVLADPSLMDRFVEIEAGFSWTKGAVTAGGSLPWLAALPLEVRIVLDDGTPVLGVHASPGRDDGDGITPDRPEAELRAALDGADARIVVAGHTHRPTDRTVGAIRALNPGSVSNPVIDDVRACYLILHADRHGHRVEHRRVGTTWTTTSGRCASPATPPPATSSRRSSVEAARGIEPLYRALQALA